MDDGAGVKWFSSVIKPRVFEQHAVTYHSFKEEDRVFHQKFGNGNVSAIEGNKLTIDFDKAGQKRVLDGFVKGA